MQFSFNPIVTRDKRIYVHRGPILNTALIVTTEEKAIILLRMNTFNDF